MMFTPARDSLSRLTNRLPLLEKLADSTTLRPDVVDKVLDTVEQDLATLDDQQMRDGLPDEQRPQADEVREAVRAHVEEIRTKLQVDAGTLEDHPQWRVVVDAWRAATPLAKSGRSRTAQREAVDKKLDAAKRVIGELSETGALCEAEAQLLVLEAAHLRERIYRDPPIDSKVTCYDMAAIIPAQQSLQRLHQRLPLLKRLAADGRVHPAALHKVIGSIETDIETLSQESELQQLHPEERKRAEELRIDADAAVTEIKDILKLSS
jgi:hypothetical protein